MKVIDYDAADLMVRHAIGRVEDIVPVALTEDQHIRLRDVLSSMFAAGITAAQNSPDQGELNRSITHAALKLYGHEMRKNARAIKWAGEEHDAARTLMRRRARMAESLARLHAHPSAN